MKPKEEKVWGFLSQFGSEDEFVGWCQVQGVKGHRYQSTRCLMAEAVKAATGVEVAVSTSAPYGWRTPLVPKYHGHWRVRDAWGTYRPLPEPLKLIPVTFDVGRFPQVDCTV